MAERIPIHWLHSQAYCEYQIFLEKVKGIQPELTLEVQHGIEAHAALFFEILYVDPFVKIEVGTPCLDLRKVKDPTSDPVPHDMLSS